MSQELYDKIAELEAKLAAASPVPYVPLAYPAMRYHASGTTKVIASAEDESAGWTDTPPPPDATTYPAYRYHPKWSPRLVASAEEAASLGEGWSATAAS